MGWETISKFWWHSALYRECDRISRPWVSPIVSKAESTLLSTNDELIPTIMLFMMGKVRFDVSEEKIIVFFLHFCIPFLNTSKKPLCRHLTKDGFEKSGHSLAFLVRQFHYVYAGSLVRKEWPTKPLRLFALKVIRIAKFFLGTLNSHFLKKQWTKDAQFIMRTRLYELITFPCFKRYYIMMMH